MKQYFASKCMPSGKHSRNAWATFKSKFDDDVVACHFDIDCNRPLAVFFPVPLKTLLRPKPQMLHDPKMS